MTRNTPPASRAERPHRLILCNDGGTLQGLTREAPIGAQGLADATVGPLVGTQVDTLYWQLGTDPGLATPSHRVSDVYSHDTRIGPRFGAGGARFDSAGSWRMYENTSTLLAEGTDPAAVVIEHGHRAGLEVFLSLRVNDIHDGSLPGPEHPLFSARKREHPEWLLGPVSKPAEGRIAGISRFAYDFGVAAVRDYKLALASEAIENYEMDGLDLDFCRFPRLFAEGREAQGAELLTDFLGRIRAALDRKGERIGRRLLLSVRVPPTFALARPFGIDVEAWLERGLLDILIAGVVHTSMHRVPVEEYVGACRGSGVQVIAQNLGMFWYGRPHSARVLYHEPGVYPDAMCRAAAANYWRAGVDGLYLWNNHVIEYWWDDRYGRVPWGEIADPALIAERDKHYVVDNPHEWLEWAQELGAPPVPAGPLPAALHAAGDALDVELDIADDVASAAARGSFAQATLRLLVVNLTARDELDFQLNDTPLDPGSAVSRILYNDFWYEFALAPEALRQGWNRLRIAIRHRNSQVAAPLTVESAEVILRYR